jgi:hypothetical protein
MVSDKNTATEHFIFGRAGEVPTSKRNVQAEVKGSKLDVEREIDAFELSRGIIRKPKTNLSEYAFNNIILDPEEQRDNEMLSKLLNDEKYLITYYKDNWTPQGTYRVFIIYGTKKEKKD